MEEARISGIEVIRDQAMLTVTSLPNKPGIAYKIIENISNNGINIDTIIQNIAINQTTDLSFSISRKNYKKTLKFLQQSVKDFTSNDVCGDNSIIKISLTGVGLRSHAWVVSKLFKTLSELEVNIKLISTSESKISIFIEERYYDLVTLKLCRAFKL